MHRLAGPYPSPIPSPSTNSFPSTRPPSQGQGQGQGQGIYFRKQTCNFGPAAVGAIHTLKADLCNATDYEVTVWLQDPDLPFILGLAAGGVSGCDANTNTNTNVVTIRPRSYVRVPVCFLPVVTGREESSLLVAHWGRGEELRILLLGVGVPVSVPVPVPVPVLSAGAGGAKAGTGSRHV